MPKELSTGPVRDLAVTKDQARIIRIAMMGLALGATPDADDARFLADHLLDLSVVWDRAREIERDA